MANWGEQSGKKKDESIALSDEIQKILNAFKVVGSRFEMSKSDLAAWETRLKKLTTEAARKTATELVALEQRFRAVNNEGTVLARRQLAGLVDVLIQKLRVSKGWERK